MDEPNTRARSPAGGTVEAVSRTRAATTEAPLTQRPGERYELRDPQAEVTYRAATLQDMVGNAQQLGISRFTAIDAEGQRTPISKVDDRWQRGTPLPAAPQRPIDPLPARDEPEPKRSRAAEPQPTRPATTTDQSAATGSTKAGPSRSAPEPASELQEQRTAERQRLQAALQDRYVIKQAPVTVGAVTVGHTEYRFRGDTSRVAFTESTFRLATDTNSPSVARSMVDVSQTRNWKALRVSGNEEFKRMVWLEASARGVKTQGYEPTLADQELLKRERENRQVNRIEPARADSVSSTPAAPAEKATSARGGGGRKTVLAAIEAVLVAKNVPEKQREAVMAAASEKLAQRIRDGQAPKVRVYDKAAPSQRPPQMPTPELQRGRERATPAPVR